MTTKENNTRLEKAAWVSYVWHQVYSIYSLFFTGFIYHSVIESFVGYFFGILIVGLTYETDIVVESLVSLFATALAPILKPFQSKS